MERLQIKSYTWFILEGYMKWDKMINARTELLEHIGTREVDYIQLRILHSKEDKPIYLEGK